MRIAFCVLLNKLVTKVCKLFGKNGSVLPGNIVYDWFKQKKILEKVKYPETVIAVTGSSGKGSTTDMIYHVLKDNGYDVCYNNSGSNGVLAATTLILNNCDIHGNFKHDILLLECDERHLKLIFGKNKPSHLIITNMTRDQPARNGHPDIVFKDIMAAVNEQVNLIINADDPLLNRLRYKHKGKITTYGVCKMSDSYETSESLSLDYQYCPFCHSKLHYKYYQYGHIGNYECPNGDFARGQVDFEVSHVDYEANEIRINGNTVYLNNDVLYALYYTVAAYALCRQIGLSDEQITASITKDKLPSKRGKVYNFAGRELTMLESKNENNLSYYQSIKYIVNQKGKKSIILGFDNVSRRYHFNDLSWLWDVDFELLNNKDIDKIICIGRFRYDVSTRLEFAKIPKDKIILVDDINTKLIPTIKNKTEGKLYTMVCFDMTANIKALMNGDESK